MLRGCGAAAAASAAAAAANAPHTRSNAAGGHAPSAAVGRQLQLQPTGLALRRGHSASYPSSNTLWSAAAAVHPGTTEPSRVGGAAASAAVPAQAPLLARGGSSLGPAA
ncbi:hypothetical protein CHLRE_09g396883v5 [Chlamydomonas reinhardtii]|uniref:Uncharacterized protein n=1 Tax=Chlamydomonas reinhardtii TaxID=3055 RepID=A0A2K3DEM2_CHLRE|nr:uncharacterized protein CHLRE_09g396883v5 [Chlamydomonas reinhardtii]PNW78991.1 hypothetical protein CHLRE_09g396883v5 [Chlamydomonas reinhardtii]